MKTIRICMGCGLPVGADAPGGLCAECLLKSGVASETGEDAVEPTPTPVPGEAFGPYKIVRLLGHGGMGRVYEAEHAGTSRRVALKVIGKALASEEDRKRFLREGRLAAAVNHPNVVYIHGSEEVEGVPAIAMELVEGGTLKDRLKREGTLSSADAVEAVIEIIDGLEAAHIAGVLHRDIKPANCFLTSDGAVKVGDFGLSVSTLARGESLLTATGSVLGTPAYASPEQLRGEELDVRSDIYSVGATLYHLLTGKTPFAATDFVKLITEVLDRQPAAPHTLRGDIPVELSRIVVRCLAKDRKDRFQDYGELRDALLPFNRAEAVPGNPGLRVVAGIVDDAIAYLPSLAFLAYWAMDPIDVLVRDRTLKAFGVWLAFYMIYFLYYSVCEGLWGSAIGKTLCGLRVVDGRGHAPGIPRAMLRVSVYVLPSIIPSLVLMAAVSQTVLREKLARGDALVTDWLWLPLTLALFLTMRRRNGFAAVHDLLSRTRVIVRPRTQSRPKLETEHAAIPAESIGHALPVFGPYETLRRLWKRDDEVLWLARDPVLRRDIWVHVHAESDANSARLHMSRPGRLRWLNGAGESGVRWDAYEAPSGAALLALCANPQPWSAVRFWLTDLAEELVELQNEAATTLSLDRVWITSTGRAVLTEFPAPGAVTTGERAQFATGDAVSVQAFLSAVADVALHRGVPAVANSQRVLLPVHAVQFLETLRRRAFDKVEFIPGNLHSLLAKPAGLTRSRRVATLALGAAVSMILALILTGIVSFSQLRAERLWKSLYPDRPSLLLAARVHSDAEDGDGADAEKALRNVRIFMADHYADVVTNEALWQHQEFSDAGVERSGIERAVKHAPQVTAPEKEQAKKEVAPGLAAAAKSQRLLPLYIVVGGVMLFTGISILIVILSVLVLGANPVLHLFGVAVVRRDGRQAGRGRLLLRWIVTWTIPAAIALLAGGSAFALSFGGVSSAMHGVANGAIVLGCIVMAILCGGGAIYAALRPNRGVADLICGTALVPK